MQQAARTKAEEEQALSGWLTSTLGRYVLAEEQDVLKAVLPMLFGRFFIQLGCWGQSEPLLTSTLPRVHYVVDESGARGVDMVCDRHRLALSSNSVDAVLLAHTLERASDPRQMLREVQRVVVAGGYVIIFGFNPWSMWGLARVLHPAVTPWSARAISMSYIGDWLKGLEFEIIKVRLYLFRPPVGGRLLAHLKCMDSLSRMNAPFLAGGYAIVAKKRVACLTPLRRIDQRRDATLGALEPTV